MTTTTTRELEADCRRAMAAGDWPRAEALGDQLDALATPAPHHLGRSAVWYAEQGLWVFPLQPRSKVPYSGSRGCHDATHDVERVKAWWTRRPDSNVGLATGHLVDVIDVDGPLGVKAWAGMDDLPQVLGTVSTPRDGGTHLYIRARGLANRAAVHPGLDYRGAGGYVVAPPSVATDGTAYRWRQPLELVGRCRVCGEAMTVVEPDEDTHPGCGRGSGL
jgi:hypothetical protein